MRGGTRGGRGLVRGGAYGGLQHSKGHKVCYVVPDRAEAVTFDVAIIGIVLVCDHFASALFDPSSTYSYVLVYFFMDLGIVCEPF